jgi:hypothetical protein
MAIVAEHEVSVVLSSHLVADLERVCDYLVVLVAMFGIVPFGYALFAFSLGATTGLLFRKRLPDLSASQPVLGVPGLRDRLVRPRRFGLGRRDAMVGEAPTELIRWASPLYFRVTV